MENLNCPFRRLGAALLIRAIRDAVGIFEMSDFTRAEKKKITNDALDWFYKSVETAIPFDLVCDSLGIDEDLVLSLIKTLRAKEKGKASVTSLNYLLNLRVSK